MTSKYKVASNVTCSETNAVEYLKTLVNNIKVDDLKERIQHFVERVDKLEETINNYQTNENLIQKIEALETKLQDVYERTINYNRGTILYQEDNDAIALSPYINHFYTNYEIRATVKTYEENELPKEDVVIDWKTHVLPGQTIEDLRANLEKTLSEKMYDAERLPLAIGNLQRRMTNLEEDLSNYPTNSQIDTMQNDFNNLLNTKMDKQFMDPEGKKVIWKDHNGEDVETVATRNVEEFLDLVNNNVTKLTERYEILNSEQISSNDISDIRNNVNALVDTEVPEIKSRIDELESIVSMPPAAIEPTE